VHEDRPSVGPCSGRLAPAWQGCSGPPAPPNDPAAWGYAARSPAAGEIWRTTPPSRTDTSAARARFSGQMPRQIRLGCIEPFPLRPDKTLPGTLHHSGNRPAPPSDHIPLGRRSAFQRGWRGNSDARPGLERVQHDDSHVPSGNLPADGKWNLVVPLPLLRRSASGNFDLIRSAKSEAGFALSGVLRVKDQSRADVRNAPTDVLIEVPRGYSRPAPLGAQPDADQMFLQLHLLIMQF
jgi:hypothetical protein